ncbi:MAG: flippase [Anaerolineae bacterium]|nr:flippase [Anaerolineae bacterium]
MSDSKFSLAQPAAHASSSNRDVLTAAKGGGIIFFGSLFSYASRFVFGIIVARSIGADGYGLYDLGVTVALILTGLSLLGLPGGIVRFLPAAIRKRDETRVWGILQVSVALAGSVSLVLALAIFGLADLLAENLFHKPALAPILRIASICIPLTAVGSIIMAALQSFKEMQYQVYADSILFNVAKIGLTVLALSAGLGAAGVLVAFTVALVVEDILLLYYLNHLFPLRRPLRAARRNVRELLVFSLPLWLTRFVATFGRQAELVLLGMLGTIVSVGVYSASLRIQAIGNLLLGAVQTAAQPIISDLHHRGEHAQLNRLYRTLTKWSLLFNLPFFLTMILFARPVLAIFGQDFTAGVLVMIIVAVGTLVDAGTGICGSMISMTGYSKLKFCNSVASLILRMILDLLLIPVWGMVGAAVATGLAIAILNVVCLLEVYWLLRYWPYDFTFVKPVVSALVALIVGFVTNRLAPADLNLFYLMLNVALLWSSYAATTILLGLSEEDQMVLNRIKRRFGAKFPS